MDLEFAPIVKYAVIRECLGKWSGRNECLENHNLMFIMKGSCSMTVDGRSYRLHEGDVTYCRRGSDREVGESTVDAEIYAFDFDLIGADSLPLPDVTHLDSLSVFMRDLKEFFYAWYLKNDGYELYCAGLLMMILSRLLCPGSEKKPHRHVKKLKEYIIEHLSEPMTVEELAHVVNLSPVYCGAIFARSEGMTIREFINFARINRARDLLAVDSMSISEIASITGYSDVFHFCKIFKRVAGTTPSEYRRLHAH